MLHPDAGTTGDRSSALVHTHGTRLVRLAHLLGVPQPGLVAADALALTLIHRGQRDAHRELMAAAQHVGAHASPPINDEPRLQGWIDRAELEGHEVDLVALQQATVERIAAQHARRSRTRRRVVAGGLVLAAGLAAASLITDDDAETPAPNAPLSTGGVNGLRPARDDPVDTRPVDLSLLLPAPPVRLPADQRSGTGIQVADAVLAGPARPIARAHVQGVPATVLAVGCEPRGGPASVCVLALAEDQALSSAQPSALLATLPLPRRDRLTSATPPAVSRNSVVDEFDLQTVLMEATSGRVRTVYATFADGQSAYATRFGDPAWDAALFVLVAGDKTPAQLSYLTDGVVQERRALYTATP